MSTIFPFLRFLVAEIVEDLQAALSEFAAIAEVLEQAKADRQPYGAPGRAAKRTSSPRCGRARYGNRKGAGDLPTVPHPRALVSASG